MSSKGKKTIAVEVMDVTVHHGGKSVDLYLRQPADMDFAPSDGIGIPASLLPQDYAEVQSLLAVQDGVEGLLPRKGKAGPDYAAPSNKFLDRLLRKACKALNEKAGCSAFNQDLKKNTACLQAAMADKALKERLQANYSVIDLLRLFPRIMSAEDIIDLQPREKGGKTYTVDGRDSVIRNGVKCFRINIAQDDGKAYRALFGETQPEGTKPGQCSTYLRGLKAGDTLAINAAVKPGPSIPNFNGVVRPVVMVCQGNAMIRVLSLLEDIRQRKAAGESFGPVKLVGAFKTQDDILELEELRSYLDDGTLDDLHLCLSRESAEIASGNEHIHMHSGIRAQSLLATDEFTQLDDPFAVVSGGLIFCEGQGSVGAYVADLYGRDIKEVIDQKRTHKDMRVSKSPNRQHSLQGQPYQGIDPAQALAQFGQKGTEHNCRSSQRAPKLR